MRGSLPRFAALPTLGFALALGLGLIVPAAAWSQDCSISGQNAFVADVLEEFYLWYRELPATDPALFDSPEAYLDAVRFRPLDESFSFITTQQASDALFSESQFVGYGFGQVFTGNELRVTEVYPGSSAAEAGLSRGDAVTAIDDRSVEELVATGDLGAALGPSEIGFSADFSWRRLDGRERRATLTKSVVTIPTVSPAEVLLVDGRPVGYVHLRNFVEPSFEALDRTFATFREAGVLDVVLDVRYNGGGLISVATHLGGLIGGLRTNTHVFVELVHNDKNTFRNVARRFEDPEATLDLPRLVVITSRASASASELVINGLEPFVPVVVVGTPSFGKPVGQYGFDFCEKVLFPVAFQNVNAVGEGDYFDGIPVDCPAQDDLSRPLAHPEEDSLEEALHFLRTGQCSSVAAREPTLLPRAEALAAYDALPHRSGFERLLNAW